MAAILDGFRLRRSESGRVEVGALESTSTIELDVERRADRIESGAAPHKEDRNGHQRDEAPQGEAVDRDHSPDHRPRRENGFAELGRHHGRAAAAASQAHRSACTAQVLTDPAEAMTDALTLE